MRFFITVILFSFTLLCLGCGNNAESIAQRSLASMKALTVAFEKADKDAILRESQKLQALLSEGRSMKISKAENKRISEKYKKEIQEETRKTTTAMMNAIKSGKIKPEDMKEITGVMHKMK